MSSYPNFERIRGLINEAQSQLDTSTPALDKAKAHSKASGLPSIAIGPHQGNQLTILCKMINAKRILEIGTLGGYSTIWFANSVPGVQVTSIEYDAKHKKVAEENLQAAGVADRTEILHGAALDILPKLEQEHGSGHYDFVFIDADWDNQAQYFEWAAKLTRKGGCIYVDNVLRQIAEAEADGSSKGMALVEMAAKLVKEGKVIVGLQSTVNTHKENVAECVDGFLLGTVL